MVVWNPMLLKIIILSSGVAKQHVRFIDKDLSKFNKYLEQGAKKSRSTDLLLYH